MRLATIDVGTNTTLLLVAEVMADGSITVLEEAAEITRLGRGIGTDGRLGEEGIERTLAALQTFATVAQQRQATIMAVGTEALRRAPNSATFLAAAQHRLGVPVEVIGGDREADLTFLAATRSFPALAQWPLMVIDIGGGSTEFIVADEGQVTFRRSVPLGSVRLTEQHLKSDPPLAGEMAALFRDIRQILAPIPFASPRPGTPLHLIGIAGTVTSLAAMTLGLHSYDAARVHGFHLATSQLENQVNRLRSSTQRERETMVGLDPKRADVILGGACLLLEIARQAQSPTIVVSDRGIRWGLLYERMPATR